MKKGRDALLRKDATGARDIFEGVRNAALIRRDDEAGFAAVQMLVLISRSSGDWAKTEDWLSEALDLSGRLRGYDGMEVADFLTDIAGARRTLGKFDGAIAALQQALGMAMKKVPGEWVRAARISTTLGLVHLENKDAEKAKEYLLTAVNAWDQTLREDPDLLPTLETLAGIYRNHSEYNNAEPLYLRSFRIREAAFGPESAELIPGLDNLAYVYFGMLRFADAEPLHVRLLKIWETTGGPEHPMLALTLDKMVEFYAAQKRFAEAETLAARAAAIRGKSFMESLRLQARIAAQQEKATPPWTSLQRPHRCATPPVF